MHRYLGDFVGQWVLSLLPSPEAQILCHTFGSYRSINVQSEDTRRQMGEDFLIHTSIVLGWPTYDEKKMDKIDS